MENQKYSPLPFSKVPATKKRKLTMDKSESQNNPEIVKMKQQIENQQKAISNLAIKITRLEEENYNLMNNNNFVDDDTVDENAQALEEELRAENEELKRKFDDETKRYESELAEMKKNVNVQIANLENQNNEKEEKIKHLEEQLLSIKNAKTDNCNKADAKVLQDKIDQLQSMNDNYSQKIKEMEEELSTHIKAVECKEDERKSLQDKIHELQATCGNYESKIKELEDQLSVVSNIKSEDSKEDEMKSLKAKIVEQQTTCTNLENEIRDLKTQLESKATAETLLQNKIVQLENERKLLQINHDVIGHQNKKIKELESKLQTKSNTEITLLPKISEIEQQRKLLQINNDKINATIKEQNKKIKDLQSRLQTKAFTETTLQRKIAKIEEHRNTLRNCVQNNVTEFKNIIEDREKLFNDAKSDLEKKEKDEAFVLAKIYVMEKNFCDFIKKNAEYCEGVLKSQLTEPSAASPTIVFVAKAAEAQKRGRGRPPKIIFLNKNENNKINDGSETPENSTALPSAISTIEEPSQPSNVQAMAPEITERDRGVPSNVTTADNNENNGTIAVEPENPELPTISPLELSSIEAQPSQPIIPINSPRSRGRPRKIKRANGFTKRVHFNFELDDSSASNDDVQ